jgi:hypothetical protein
MSDVASITRALCDVGARSMQRYSEVSGEAPDALPEYFMPAFIFHELGQTVTLETGFSKLIHWNNEARKHRNIPPRSTKEEEELLALAEELGTPRVDMVIYGPQRDGIPKEEYEFLALAEFKKGEFSRDRDKLLRVLRHIETCPYGIVCGSITGDANLKWWRNEVKKTTDEWYESEVTALQPTNQKYFFCARLFRNPTAR